jgi:hypothetical protein
VAGISHHGANAERAPGEAAKDARAPRLRRSTNSISQDLRIRGRMARLK